MAQSKVYPGPKTSIWWSGGDEIRFTVNDDRYPAVDGHQSGLMFVVSRNPRSANYHPRNWNKFVAWLVAAGQPAPSVIPVRSRSLSMRDKVIAAYDKAKVLAGSAS